MYRDLHVKYPLFLSNFNETRIFSTDFSRNTQISNFIKIRGVEAELFYAEEETDRQTDGRTDRHDAANSRFSQFCERAQKSCDLPAVVRHFPGRIDSSLSLVSYHGCSW
jgi:hypothetical protein